MSGDSEENPTICNIPSQSFNLQGRGILSHACNLHRSKDETKPVPQGWTRSTPFTNSHRDHTCTNHTRGHPLLMTDDADQKIKKCSFINKGRVEIKGAERWKSFKIPIYRRKVPFSFLLPLSFLSLLSLLFLSCPSFSFLFLFVLSSLLSLSLSAPPPPLLLLSLSFYSIGLPGNLTETSLKSRPIEPRSQIAPRAHWIFLQMSNKRWTQLRFRETQKSILRLPPVTLRD